METKSKTYRSVVAKINAHIRKNSFIYADNSRWYVGITNDIKRRKAEHLTENPFLSCFASYYAGSMKIAAEIEAHFTQKGTLNASGSRGATKESKWVYVYKDAPTVLD